MALTLTAVVPTYRRPTLLERALRSIAAQTCAATEVIVVDDTQGGQSDLLLADRCLNDDGRPPA
jgi:glycosyltransferase involved in cell wall biosynthesis